MTFMFEQSLHFYKTRTKNQIQERLEITVGGMAGCRDCRERFKLFKISAMLSLFFFFLIVPQTAWCSFLGDYKAVFEKPCQETVTLKNPLPPLHDFLVCVYLKLGSSVNPWTAFTYKVTPSDSAGGYDLGLAGDSGSLIVWMFGNQIVVPEKLNPATWYLACIQWESTTANMTFFINGVPAKWKQLSTPSSLAGGGSLLLGCSQTPDMSSFGSVGLIGELYMFRMWDKADQKLSSACSEGNTIRWDTIDWNYNESAFQLDRSLHCGKTKKVSDVAEPVLTTESALVHSPGYVNKVTGLLDRIVRGLADSGTSPSRYSPTLSARRTAADSPTLPVWHAAADITTFTEYYNHTEIFVNISSNITSESTVFPTTYNISHVGNWSCSFNFTDSLNGTALPDNVCDLSTVYNGSEFYNIKFKITSSSDNSTEIEKYINDIFRNPTPALVNSTCLANMDPLINSSASSLLPDLLNQTDSSIACTSKNSGRSVQCQGLVKLCRGMNLCNFTGNILKNYRHKLEIRSANFCCCVNGSFGPAVNEDLSTLLCYENNTSYTDCGPGGAGSGGSSSSSSEKPASSGTTRSSTLDVSTSYTTQNIIPSPEDTDNLDDLNDLLNSTNLNASIVNRITTRLEGVVARNITQKQAGILVGVLSKFLNVSPALLAPVSNRVIMVVDTIGLKVKFTSNSVNFTSPSLALAVTKINASTFTETSFSIQNSAGLQVDLNTSQVPIDSAGLITLPSSILDNLTASNKDLASRIQFNFFEKTSLFQDHSLVNQSLISHVISAGVSNLTISNLTTDITVKLRTSIPANQEHYKRKCVFWDFTKNNRSGGWASEGCVKQHSQGNETVCKCNHLTSFGVLLDFSRNSTYSPLDILILTFITYIGCGISAIFLAITLVTYIAFEKIRRDYPSQILIQLCAALLCLNLTFLLDSWIALYNAVPGLCISVAVFLHYFLLVTFTWMGLEAFHMYLSLVKVFNTYVRKYILKFCIVGWGLPAIVVAIVVAISRENYGLGYYGKYPNGSSDEFCWLNSDIAFYITVVGYFCVIFLLNVGMFIVVLIQLCRIKKKKQLGNQRRPTFQDLRSVAGLTFLMGITWGFAFFAWGPVNLPFMYLFCIFNTLQGFFIFIFYCVAKENVRKQWRRYLCCGRFRLAENSDWSRTATNFLKKQAINPDASGSSNNSLQSNSNGNSTNSATLLVNNEYSVHQSSNGHLSKEKNGVSFNLENGDVSLQAFTANSAEPNDDVTGGKATNATHRRTSTRGREHIIDQ